MRKRLGKLTVTPLKTRDLLMVALINGATKAGIAQDKRKQASKRACRGKIRIDE